MKKVDFSSRLLVKSILFTSLVGGLYACGSKSNSDTKESVSAISCNYNGQVGNSQQECDALKARSGGGSTTSTGSSSTSRTSSSSSTSSSSGGGQASPAGVKVEASCSGSTLSVAIKEGNSQSSFSLSGSCRSTSSCNGSQLRVSTGNSSGSASLSSPQSCAEAQRQLAAFNF